MAVGATVLPIPDIVKYASYLKGFEELVVVPTVCGMEFASRAICLSRPLP